MFEQDITLTLFVTMKERYLRIILDFIRSTVRVEPKNYILKSLCYYPNLNMDVVTFYLVVSRIRSGILMLFFLILTS